MSDDHRKSLPETMPHAQSCPRAALDNDAAVIPRVSIGVPVYNGERFLQRALDSLLAQTYTDFELVISDNASTDSTLLICEDYARRDDRVRVLRQNRNIGAPRNWNFVATQARGEYFKWATANDEVAPTMLERCVAELDRDPTAVLCQGVTCLIDEVSEKREPYALDLALPEGSPSERLRSLCQKLALNNGQSGLIRTSALRRTHFDRPYPGGDFVLMAELALLGKFIVVPEVLLYRRMGPATFSRSLRGSQLRDFYAPESKLADGPSPLRQHTDLLCSVITSPIPLVERSRAALFALRRMAWARGRILSASTKLASR